MFRTSPIRRARRRLWRLVLFVAVFVLSVLLLARIDTHAAPRAISTPAKFAAAFVNWGATGREHMLQSWEKWLSQKPSSVLAVDFYAQESWDEFSKMTWLPGFWKRLNPDRNIVWSTLLTAKGTSLSEVADGLHDDKFEAAARAIAAEQPRAIIRLGWEMNLDSMAWFAKDNNAEYIRAFRHVVGIFRRYSGDFKFDWCPGWGPQETPADLAYPGDDVVDYIGLDVYDFKYEGTPEERWEKYYLKGPFGLEWHRDFAAAHGKLMSYPEWGVGNFGDNPYFIQQMHDWFAQNQKNIAYAAYFNVDGQWPTQIDNGKFPKSQKLFRALFKR